MALRILLIKQFFDPEPTIKGLAFAKELMLNGFEVEVLTGFPNYPGGKVYAGYKVKLIQREVIDGVNVTRVPLYPSHDASAIRRVLNYLSFSASALIYGLFFARRADAIYAYHPPLTVGIAAALIGKVRKTPLIYDIQDLWPDTLHATGMLKNRKALSVVDFFCRQVYKAASRIIVLSPGFKNILTERKVDPVKITVIYNWADKAALESDEGTIHSDFPDTDCFSIVFAGNIGKAQALDSVLAAAKILQERRSKVVFVLIGGGLDVERLKSLSTNLNLDNVRFIPRVPMSQVGVYLRRASALLVHLRKDRLFEITIPSKTQAYMAIGKPLLMCVDGDAARLVKTAKAGIFCESENALELADSAERLSAMPPEELRQFGENARNYYQNNLTLEVGVQKISNVIKGCVGKIYRS